MTHQLYREQHLDCDIRTAWEFFSSPLNLAKITAAELGFVVCTENLAQQPLYEGMEIEYIVSPLLRIPLRWKTVITQVEHLKSFTDFQQKGPYRQWKHRHDFIQLDNGTLMKDTVDYELPFGPLGTLAHQLFVKKKIEDIFAFRAKTLTSLFTPAEHKR